MVSEKVEGSSTATSNGYTQGAVMSDDVNFEFAFNSRTFSDRILKIEVADEPPSNDLDSKGDQIPDLKMKKCEETTNDDKELGSAAAADSSGILLGVELVHVISVILAAKRKFFFKLFSNGKQENNDNKLGSAAAADSSEIILRVESVHVSSVILAAKSKFFYKLFSNGMQESDQQHVTVRVSLSEEPTFMELIRFMYSGKLSSISHPFLLGVLTIADKFEVPTCMNHCIQQAMALTMTTESAMLYLDLPPALSMVSAVEPLVNAAKEFLGNKYKRIMAVSKDELLTLSLTAMEAIFRSDNLEIPEEDNVYDILVEWAHARYPKPEELRDVFNHRLAPLVRFAHMSNGKLTKLLVSSDLKGDLASKLITDALIFKAESPLRQQELQAADGWFPQRSYTRVPFKMVELESHFPHCIIYLDFKKDQLAKLFPSAEEFSGVPYTMTMLNCLLSAWYGLPFISPNNMLVSTINGTGAVLEGAYVLIFIVFASKKERAKMLGLLAAVCSVFGAVALVSVLALHGQSRKLFCGTAAAFFSICMYASPLSIMRLVVRTKSVEFMPFLLSLFVFLCGTSWFIYGLLGRDPFVAVPNGCGSALGAVQLILYAIYRNHDGAADIEKGDGAEMDDLKKPAQNPQHGNGQGA